MRALIKSSSSSNLKWDIGKRNPQAPNLSQLSQTVCVWSVARIYWYTNLESTDTVTHESPFPTCGCRSPESSSTPTSTFWIPKLTEIFVFKIATHGNTCCWSLLAKSMRNNFNVNGLIYQICSTQLILQAKLRLTVQPMKMDYAHLKCWC